MYNKELSLPYSSKEDDESIVISALKELQSSRSNSPHVNIDCNSPSPPLSDSEQFYDTTSTLESELSRRQRLIKKVRSHPIVDNAVRVYKSNKQYGVEMMEKATLPVVNILEQTTTQWKRKRSFTKSDEDEEVEAETQNHESKRVKKQKLPSISEALAISNRNLNGLNYRLSAESSKKIATCLQLLILANNQIAGKVTHLQQILTKEQKLLRQRQIQRETSPLIDENGDTFHDAQSTLPEIAQIKTELVSTMKKLVHFLSTHAGSSLPEPARSNVRETLLRLPIKLQRSSQIYTNTNGKVLGFANESLDAVGGIIKVLNETLGKAEGWVKEKQLQKQQKQQQKEENRTMVLGNLRSRRRDNNNNNINNKSNTTNSSNEIMRNAIWNRMNLSKEKMNTSSKK